MKTPERKSSWFKATPRARPGVPVLPSNDQSSPTQNNRENSYVEMDRSSQAYNTRDLVRPRGEQPSGPVPYDVMAITTHDVIDQNGSMLKHQTLTRWQVS